MLKIKVPNGAFIHYNGLYFLPQIHSGRLKDTPGQPYLCKKQVCYKVSITEEYHLKKILFSFRFVPDPSINFCTSDPK
ncbi:hypothetical protein C874_12005 [Elizabethkingia anophelis 502]|nr:hypothetical protein C874_12005 [Elizabethkingia anophelis 502]